MTLTTVPAAPVDGEIPPLLIRVLVADDSPAMRTLARSFLRSSKGFSVAVACDGAEALTMYDAHRPDCVVLDIEMPRMGGFEALDELRRRCPEVPVVMLSGHSDPAVASQAKARGAVAYLDKSSEMGRLAETVRRVTQPGAAPPAAVPPTAPPDRTGTTATPGYLPRAVEAVATTGDSTAAADLRRLEYVISHDFAEPVRIMGGFATLLDKRYAAGLDTSGQAFLAHLVDGAQRMQRMVDDLLVYSRAGRAIAQPELVDVGQLVEDVAAEVASPTAESPVEVTAGHLPCAWADAAMLRTVLQHVVRNGLTFNTAAVPRVEIAGKVVGDSCVLTVTDNGIGVSPSHAEEVFELFRRLGTRDEHPGTGTGLALCRRLLTHQAGTITLSPAAAGGTVVTITLPTAPVPTPSQTEE